jgi:hypothetical protein
MTDQNTKALLLLRDGFKDEFWRFVANNERFDQLMADLATEFVEENIPIVDEDLQIDMAMLLRETDYTG